MESVKTQLQYSLPADHNTCTNTDKVACEYQLHDIVDDLLSIDITFQPKYHRVDEITVGAALPRMELREFSF